MSAQNNIHEGHRERMKARYLSEGLDNFNEINVLELMLFYCVQRRDTNPLAHRLLERFGNLNKVLSASIEELMRVDGVTLHIATFLSMFPAVNRYCMIRKNDDITTVKTTIDSCKYLTPYFENKKKETVYLLCLDAKCKVLCCKCVSEGSLNAADISVRNIVETAMNANATSVVMAHNHPSGVAVPSFDDIQVTRRVAAALKLVEIVLSDHVIVADDDAVSMLDSGYSIH